MCARAAADQREDGKQAPHPGEGRPSTRRRNAIKDERTIAYKTRTLHVVNTQLLTSHLADLSESDRRSEAYCKFRYLITHSLPTVLTVSGLRKSGKTKSRLSSVPGTSDATPCSTEVSVPPGLVRP
jgi:hypothetical protein